MRRGGEGGMVGLGDGRRNERDGSVGRDTLVGIEGAACVGLMECFRRR